MKAPMVFLILSLRKGCSMIRHCWIQQCRAPTVQVINVPTASTQIHSTQIQESSDQASFTSVDPDSDTVGDLAIAKFHCDCPPCRMAIVQMLQTGQLAL